MHAEERLRAWLTPKARPATAAELRVFFDVDADALSRECRDAMTFALVVLRDLYADDEDVSRWLDAARDGFDGASATDLLRRGEGWEVTAAVVRAWYHSWRREAREDTIDLVLALTT
jgi:hypothetical protein